MKLVVSLHAQKRMLERNINENNISKAIRFPKRREIKPNGSIKISSDKQGPLIHVVYMPFKNGAFIKTVFWDGEEE